MAASPHALADPRRSCRGSDGEIGPGGVWHVPRKETATGEMLFHTDIKAALDRVGPPIGLGRKMLLSEIKGKMRRGAQGELTYGRRAEVVHFARVKDLLELRVTKLFGDEPDERLHARIYFNEPASEPGVLKFLSLDCKRGGKAGLIEQDRQARRARKRLTSYTFEALGDWL